jgi:PAS domain S-box-containing protein
MPHTRYHRLFETARDGIMILDSETRRIIDANPSLTHIVNKPFVSILGKTPAQIGIFRNKTEMEKILGDLEDKEEVSFENIEIKDKTRSEKCYRLIANLYYENNRGTIQCNIREITERKQYERDLFNSKQRLEALMNALPVGVSFSSDVTCEYITGNATLLRKLELAPGENISVSTLNKNVAGRKLKHYANGKLIPKDEMPMQKAIRENRVVGPMEINIKLPSGKNWCVESFASPILDEGGNVIAAVAVNVDLTERKRAEEANELERLMEQEKLKIDFIADATHELRTPLAIIKGHVDLALKTKSKLSDDLKDSLISISDEINYLGNLISDLTLLISNKGGEFKRSIGNKKVELASLIERTAKRHEDFARRRKIEIKIKDIPKTKILGDESYLERLFSNIITNAISYGKEDGYILISASKGKRDIRIDIKDNGIGIPLKDLPHIFERFYRVDSSRSKDSGGSGLGLAIVKWIAEAHGGRVSATSEQEKGSTFSVTFPYYTENKNSSK